MINTGQNKPQGTLRTAEVPNSASSADASLPAEPDDRQRRLVHLNAMQQSLSSLPENFNCIARSIKLERPARKLVRAAVDRAEKFDADAYLNFHDRYAAVKDTLEGVQACLSLLPPTIAGVFISAVQGHQQTLQKISPLVGAASTGGLSSLDPLGLDHTSAAVVLDNKVLYFTALAVRHVPSLRLGATNYLAAVEQLFSLAINVGRRRTPQACPGRWLDAGERRPDLQTGLARPLSAEQCQRLLRKQGLTGVDPARGAAAVIAFAKAQGDFSSLSDVEEINTLAVIKVESGTADPVNPRKYLAVADPAGKVLPERLASQGLACLRRTEAHLRQPAAETRVRASDMVALTELVGKVDAFGRASLAAGTLDQQVAFLVLHERQLFTLVAEMDAAMDHLEALMAPRQEAAKAPLPRLSAAAIADLENMSLQPKGSRARPQGREARRAKTQRANPQRRATQEPAAQSPDAAPLSPRSPQKKAGASPTATPEPTRTAAVPTALDFDTTPWQTVSHWRRPASLREVLSNIDRLSNAMWSPHSLPKPNPQEETQKAQEAPMAVLLRLRQRQTTQAARPISVGGANLLSRLPLRSLRALLEKCIHPSSFLRNGDELWSAAARSAAYHVGSHAPLGTPIEDYLFAAFTAYQRHDGGRLTWRAAYGGEQLRCVRTNDTFANFSVDGRLFTYVALGPCPPWDGPLSSSSDVAKPGEGSDNKA